tara:strand:+ start:211 stop:612 length:402 start_codon:yes stop_codon:yes gene_type:complete
MRVKITKTVHANDIPGETRRMLDGAKNKIMYGMPDQMAEIVRMSLSNQGHEYFQVIELIEVFRKELAALDENLQETQNIIQGYKDAVMPREQTTPEQTSEDEHDEEWLENEQAEYEKFMSQVAGSEEGFDEEG